jgi:hypothetical protein
MKPLLYILLFLHFIFFSSLTSAATFLYFNSQPGDYIGQGIERTWTTDDGVFNAFGEISSNVVEINFNGTDWWYLDFAAPSGQTLQPGPYDGATRYPFQSPTLPGLSVYGDGGGCNTLTGRFDVLEISYTAGGQIDRFAADFEQHCEGMAPALFGSVRYNASVGFPPQVAVTANGSHTPIIIKVGETVEIKISVEAGDKEGTIAEKWLGILGPNSDHWYAEPLFPRYNRSAKWVLSSQPRMWERGPIETFEKKLEWTFNTAGVYLIMFASDEQLDGRLSTQYVDHVVVTVKKP